MIVFSTDKRIPIRRSNCYHVLKTGQVIESTDDGLVDRPDLWYDAEWGRPHGQPRTHHRPGMIRKRVDVVCPCGEVFLRRSVNHRYCSPDCAAKAAKRRAREGQRAKRATPEGRAAYRRYMREYMRAKRASQ